jgi:DNA-binding LacI/PurR family transcriptional regulator
MLAGSRVDGIVLDSVAGFDNRRYFDSLANLASGKKEIPVVSLERNLSKYGIFSVHVDNIEGGRLASRHLLEKGCKNIALITGPAFSDIVKDRVTGYREALEEAGASYDPNRVLQGDYTPLSGYRAAKRLLLDGIPFDGLFACNDQMAVGALKALNENGVRIPEAVKVIGFDNTFVSSLVSPSLTTVNVPKFRIGSTAAQYLIGKLNPDLGDVTEPYPTLGDSCQVPISITVRGSTEKGKDTGWELEYW